MDMRMILSGTPTVGGYVVILDGAELVIPMRALAFLTELTLALKWPDGGMPVLFADECLTVERDPFNFHQVAYITRRCIRDNAKAIVLTVSGGYTLSFAADEVALSPALVRLPRLPEGVRSKIITTQSRCEQSASDASVTLRRASMLRTPVSTLVAICATELVLPCRDLTTAGNHGGGK